MNSAATVGEAPQVIQPEESNLIDWNTFYNNYGREKYGSQWIEADPDHWATKFANFFTGDRDRAKNFYEAYKENYLNNLNSRNEAKATQSAQSYDEYMSNTAYSRGFVDMQRSGINPYLIINSGSAPATSTGSASKPNYSYSKPGTKDTQSNTKMRDLALIALAIAKIAAVL